MTVVAEVVTVVAGVVTVVAGVVTVVAGVVIAAAVVLTVITVTSVPVVPSALLAVFVAAVDYIFRFYPLAYLFFYTFTICLMTLSAHYVASIDRAAS